MDGRNSLPIGSSTRSERIFRTINLPASFSPPAARREAAPANHFEAVTTMEERAEVTAEIFMGSRLQCSKCHNHPFENWTMRDYYSLAAVFCRTKDENGVVTIA